MPFLIKEFTQSEQKSSCNLGNKRVHATLGTKEFMQPWKQKSSCNFEQNEFIQF